ncbi:hypothetical protein [Actinophytocola xinjiangensis]|uniref:hypothetical protein n=1 Tax=Actinophytocola xinjiangensis TaxID=485602 RepID=UPI001FEA85AE|nr:hypothetical protein [Actinophytocola xinjiangensis]
MYSATRTPPARNVRTSTVPRNPDAPTTAAGAEDGAVVGFASPADPFSWSMLTFLRGSDR